VLVIVTSWPSPAAGGGHARAGAAWAGRASIMTYESHDPVTHSSINQSCGCYWS